MPRTYDNLSGGIKDSIIYAKYDVTEMPEESAEELMDGFNRLTLTDLSCDEPLWESDRPRNGGYDPRTGESRGGGSYSRSIIEARDGGRRNNTESYLPEGSFIDHEFLAPDPRGTATGPDMTKFTDQSWARGRFIKLHNDDDLSVPESGVNPGTMVRNIRQHAFRQGRERIKIFGTSKDNFVVGVSGLPVGKAGNSKQVRLDGAVVDIGKSEAMSRVNRTTIISNDPLTGWASVPDHEVAVAKYGDNRRYPSMATADLGKNRRYGEVDTSNLPVNVRDQVVSKTLAMTMASYLATQSFRKQFTADGTTFGDSMELANRDMIFRQHQDAIGGILSEVVEHTADAGESTERINRKMQTPNSPFSELLFNTDSDRHIVELMEVGTRRMAQKGEADEMAIRKQIEMSAVFGTETTAATRRVNQQVDAPPLGKIVHTQDSTDTRETANYAGYAPLPKQSINKVGHAHSAYEGTETRQYSSGPKNRSAHLDDFQTDNPQHESTEQFASEMGSMRDKFSNRRSINESHLLATSEL